MIKKDKYLILIGILIIYGFILRIYKLSNQSLWIDEGFSINAAVQTIKYGYPLLESGFVYSGTLLHNYLVTFSILIFKNLIFSSRLVSVLFGTLTIIVSYWLGREFFNKKVGLITAFFISFSVWEISWSRQARMYSMLQFFFLLSLLTFYKFIKFNRLKYFLVFTFATLSAILSHSLGFLLLPIYVIYFFANPEDFKIFFELVKNFFRKYKIYFLILSMFSFIFIIYFVYSSIVNSNFIDVNYFVRYLSFLRFSYQNFFFLGLIGMLISLKNLKKNSLLIFAFFIPLIFISFVIYLFHFRYLFFIAPLLFIFTSYLIYFFSNFFRRFSYLFIIMVVTLLSFNGFNFITKEEYELENLTPQPNFKEIYSYIKENSNDEIIIDSYPVLSKIYLNKVNCGLKFSLTGREEDIFNKTNDVYTNVPFIDLDGIKRTDRCYLVVDNLALDRIDNDLRTYIESMSLIKKNGSKLSEVRLYKC